MIDKQGRHRRPVLARLFEQVVIRADGCWGWIGHINKYWYARFAIGGVQGQASRRAFELWRHEIPDGMQVDHLCRNRECVNPSHLEIVSPKENTLRGNTLGAMNSAKTECIRGHEFDSTQKQGKHRLCQKCQTEQKRLRRQRRRASGLPYQ